MVGFKAIFSIQLWYKSESQQTEHLESDQLDDLYKKGREMDEIEDGMDKSYVVRKETVRSAWISM